MSNTKLWLITICGVVFAFLLYQLRPVLGEFLAAGIIAYLLSPLCEYLERKTRMKHWVAVLFVFIGVLVLFISIIVVMVPVIIAQITKLINDIPQYTKSISAFAESARLWADGLGVPSGIIDSLTEALSKSDGVVVQTLVDFGKNLLASSMKIIEIVFIAVLVLYFLMDGKKLVASFIEFFPKKVQYRVENVVVKSDTLVWRFLKAQVIIALFVFIVTWIGLEIMRVDYALLLAVIAFLFNFIPMFGSLFAGVLATVVALFTAGWVKAITVCIFIIIVQQVEGNIISPKVQSQQSGMHAVAILFSLLACNQLFGPVGMFFAVPIAGFTRLAFIEMRDLLREMK